MGLEAIPSKMNLSRSPTNKSWSHKGILSGTMLLDLKGFWSFVKILWAKSNSSPWNYTFASDSMCEGKFRPCLRPMWAEEWGPMCSVCKPEWELRPLYPLSHSVQRRPGDTDYARMWFQWPQPVPGGSHDLCWHSTGPGDKIGATIKEGPFKA